MDSLAAAGGRNIHQIRFDSVRFEYRIVRESPRESIRAVRTDETHNTPFVLGVALSRSCPLSKTSLGRIHTADGGVVVIVDTAAGRFCFTIHESASQSVDQSCIATRSYCMEPNHRCRLSQRNPPPPSLHLSGTANVAARWRYRRFSFVRVGSPPPPSEGYFSPNLKR